MNILTKIKGILTKIKDILHPEHCPHPATSIVKTETNETEQRVLAELKRYFRQPNHDKNVTQHSTHIEFQNWDCPIYGELYLITKEGRIEEFSKLLKENGFTMFYQECDMIGGQRWDIWETPKTC